MTDSTLSHTSTDHSRNTYKAQKVWPPDFTKLDPKHQFRFERRYRRRAKLKWARPQWTKAVKITSWGSCFGTCCSCSYQTIVCWPRINSCPCVRGALHGLGHEGYSIPRGNQTLAFTILLQHDYIVASSCIVRSELGFTGKRLDMDDKTRSYFITSFEFIQ